MELKTIYIEVKVYGGARMRRVRRWPTTRFALIVFMVSRRRKNRKMNEETDIQRIRAFKETHLATNPRHIYVESEPEQCWTCFLISRLEGALPAAAKWWQVYQDRCEGAYMEVTLHKERVKELQEAISHRNERIAALQQEVMRSK